MITREKTIDKGTFPADVLVEEKREKYSGITTEQTRSIAIQQVNADRNLTTEQKKERVTIINKSTKDEIFDYMKNWGYIEQFLVELEKLLDSKKKSTSKAPPSPEKKALADAKTTDEKKWAKAAYEKDKTIGDKHTPETAFMVSIKKNGKAG